MPKQFQFKDDARSQLMEGIDLMARTVGITLGPNGRNVILEKEFGPPQVCSDGVTIAKEIDPIYAENFINAKKNGVEMEVWACDISVKEIKLSHQLQFT